MLSESENWTPFQPSIDISACDVCGHYADLLRGGRRKSKKKATTGTDLAADPTASSSCPDPPPVPCSTAPLIPSQAAPAPQVTSGIDAPFMTPPTPAIHTTSHTTAATHDSIKAADSVIMSDTACATAHADPPISPPHPACPLPAHIPAPSDVPSHSFPLISDDSTPTTNVMDLSELPSCNLSSILQHQSTHNETPDPTYHPLHSLVNMTAATVMKKHTHFTMDQHLRIQHQNDKDLTMTKTTWLVTDLH